MSVNNGDPARGEFSDSELDIVLSAANEELLHYVHANANSRATLLRIMEIRDKDRYRPIRHDGAGGPVMLPQADREPLRRWDPEQIGPYVILGRLRCGAMGQVYLGRSAAGWSR